jgi:hypothetical protein
LVCILLVQPGLNGKAFGQLHLRCLFFRLHGLQSYCLRCTKNAPYSTPF